MAPMQLQLLTLRKVAKLLHSYILSLTTGFCNACLKDHIKAERGAVCKVTLN